MLHRISMDVLALFPRLMVKSGHDASAATAATVKSLCEKEDSDSEVIVCHGRGS